MRPTHVAYVTRSKARHRAPVRLLRLHLDAGTAGVRRAAVVTTTAALASTCALAAHAAPVAPKERSADRAADQPAHSAADQRAGLAADLAADHAPLFAVPNPFEAQSDEEQPAGPPAPADVSSVVAVPDARDGAEVVATIGESARQLATVAGAEGASSLLVFVAPTDSPVQSDLARQRDRKLEAEEAADRAQRAAEAKEASAFEALPTLPGQPEDPSPNPFAARLIAEARAAREAAVQAEAELAEAEQDVAVEELATAVSETADTPTEVRVIVDPTPEDVAAVEAERVRIEAIARAEAGLAEARGVLDEALTAGESALDGSIDKVLDDAVRAALLAALDGARATADAPLDTEDADTIDQRTRELGEHTEAVRGATTAVEQAVEEWKAEQERLKAEAEARAEAQRAEYVRLGTEAPNGHLPDAALVDLSFAPGHRVRGDAAEDLEHLNAAFRDRFGHDLRIVSSYRSYAAQVAVKKARGAWAAAPGHSNHGWGLAVDLSGAAATWGTAERDWLVEHAGDFGWRSPDWAQRGGNKPEPWHWEYGTTG